MIISPARSKFALTAIPHREALFRSMRETCEYFMGKKHKISPRCVELHNGLLNYGNKNKAVVLQRFFKTGKGEYGEGDCFIGVTVPIIRKVIREYTDLNRADLTSLLQSSIHELRLAALLILVKQYQEVADFLEKKASNRQVKKLIVFDATELVAEQKAIYEFYLEQAKSQRINNWDLVDLSAPHIVGHYLFYRDKSILHELALADDLWLRRIAIISTFHFIRGGVFDETLLLAKKLLDDKEDLIHKAVGWMLREVGKRDAEIEQEFLIKQYKKIPRTTLRYAIERFPETLRKQFLLGIHKSLCQHE